MLQQIRNCLLPSEHVLGFGHISNQMQKKIQTTVNNAGIFFFLDFFHVFKKYFVGVIAVLLIVQQRA